MRKENRRSCIDREGGCLAGFRHGLPNRYLIYSE